MVFCCRQCTGVFEITLTDMPLKCSTWRSTEIPDRDFKELPARWCPKDLSGELGALCGEKPQETAALNRVVWWDFHNRGQGFRGPCSFLIQIETNACSKEECCFLQRMKNAPTSGPSLSQISPLLSCPPSAGHRLSAHLSAVPQLSFATPLSLSTTVHRPPLSSGPV